jgi:crotonobetainyl-CoA:carnitine CoA-transferase CaiB-like acyl-CoA transferase
MSLPDETPLQDVTVLDLTVALAGPVATLLLGGLGARVIKVEEPGVGDSCRENAPFFGQGGVKLTRERADDLSVTGYNRLRNKWGVTLNLKHSSARQVLVDLTQKADVVVENFSPGTLHRLGFGYDFFQKTNPGVVHCSITGFGSEPREGSTRALDTTIQALSGVMYLSGQPNDPPVRIGLTIADLTAAQFAVIGVLAALHRARLTGAGQHVDISMLGVLTALVASEAYEAMERCGAPIRSGQTVQRLAPFGVYRAADGYVAICAYTDRLAHSLFAAMQRPDLTEHPHFGRRDDRVKHAAEVDATINEWTGARPIAEIVRKLQEANVPAAEVRDPKKAVRDPGVLGRGETVPLSHPQYGAVDDVYAMGMPIQFSDSHAAFDQPPPALGEHNNAVYGGILGYSRERIEQLRAAGAI